MMKASELLGKGETLALPGAVIEVVEASDRVVETVRITKRKK